MGSGFPHHPHGKKLFIYSFFGGKKRAKQIPTRGEKTVRMSASKSQATSLVVNFKRAPVKKKMQFGNGREKVSCFCFVFSLFFPGCGSLAWLILERRGWVSQRRQRRQASNPGQTALRQLSAVLSAPKGWSCLVYLQSAARWNRSFYFDSLTAFSFGSLTSLIRSADHLIVVIFEMKTIFDWFRSSIILFPAPK